MDYTVWKTSEDRSTVAELFATDLAASDFARRESMRCAQCTVVGRPYITGEPPINAFARRIFQRGKLQETHPFAVFNRK